MYTLYMYNEQCMLNKKNVGSRAYIVDTVLIWEVQFCTARLFALVSNQELHTTESDKLLQT